MAKDRFLNSYNRDKINKRLHDLKGTADWEKYKVPFVPKHKRKKDLSVLIKKLGGIPRC